MKIIIAFYFISLPLLIFSQLPIGGKYDEMAKNHVKSVKEQVITILFETPDTSIVRMKIFDINGFLLEEHFQGYLSNDCYYKFQYNANGFITHIDSTSNNFNYTHQNSGDTVYSKDIITWEHTDNGKRKKRLVNEWYDNDSSVYEIDYYYDSIGRMIKLERKAYQNLSNFNYIAYNSAEFFYNKYGLIEEEIDYDGNGNVMFKTNYIYEYY